VQSLHDERLKLLGRLEPYGGSEQILEAIAQTQGLFDTFNVDMIFNLPRQSLEELDEDIALLRATGVDQISYHPLMPTDDDLHGTSAFGKVDFKQEAAMYRRIVEGLAPEYQMGSVWCFNRKPQLIDEYFVSNPNYLGIGSGAFSLLDHCFYATDFDIARYMQTCRSGGAVFEMRQPLGVVAMYVYRLLTRMFGVRVPVEQVKEVRVAVMLLRILGIVRYRSVAGECFYELTSRGRYVWLVMMRRFFMNVNRYRQQLRRGEHAPCPFTASRALLRIWSR
jgi:coproporphyrinogen III oxidase-like Fe-S oxidoreductase